MSNQLLGHVVGGIFFLINGLWHLFNHIKLYSLNPNSYTFLPWFPAAISRRLELYLTMTYSSLALIRMIFLRPKGHQPALLLPDAEHSSLSFSFFIYAALATLLDLSRATSPRAARSLTLLLNAFAYIQSFLIIHFHSTDHAGLEGRYHELVQLLILACVATTLVGIAFPRSFTAGFANSLAVMFLGTWNVFIGLALWSGPTLMPKGCFLGANENGMKHSVIICSGNDALKRAKSYANLQFNWFMIGIAVFGVSLWLTLVRVYNGKEHYHKLPFTKSYDLEQGDVSEEQEEY